ncbi:MAG TPA: hypothetical protein VFE90_17820, partial [Myxococcales bacterium]|nr:hypothetical protein [Myxococcales bacterium]
MAARVYLVALATAAIACGRDPARAPATAAASAGAAPAQSAQAVVTAKNGKVELLRAADGSISEAKVGDKLDVRDALRTGVGEADVAVEGVRMRLHEDSQVLLKEVTHEKMRARVRGLVESDVAEKGRLDLEAESSDAV